VAVDAPDLTLRYAEHVDGVIDLHLQATGTGPTVLLIHGGFWKQVYDRTHTRPMARALAELGYVVATPEYRRVGGGGGWPTTWHDVEAAATALPGLCAQAGLSWSDPVVVGHSAGGHLALLFASADVPLSGVVALAAVSDLDAALDLSLGSGAAVAFLDGASPASADPMSLVPRPGLPVSLVHGTADEDVPVSLSRNYAARHPGTVLTELGCGHMELITPGSIAWPAVVRAVESSAEAGR